jgi:pimeloyl-ACP methyl ester carboxylesterase
MGKRKVWLVIALGILGSLVAWALLGRNVWNATTIPVGSAALGSATLERAMNNVCRCDTSGHKVSFVTVEPGVQLEVLDWGGTGETLVLLTGIGDNAHVFDEFAYQFNDRFHVIGITRRGFGRSSQPAHGYDVNTRARDDIAVLDKLNIRDAVFVGHSVSGTELNKLGAVYPDRVKKLVYLDALDIGSGGWATLPQPPPPPEDTAADLESVQRFAAASARDDGYRKPLAAICNMIRMDPSGRVVGAITPPEISSKIYAGLQPAEYGRIQAPALGIFNKITPQYRLPYYWYLDPAGQEEFNRNIEALAKWIEGAIQRFRTGVKNSRVIELHDTNHYVFIVDEALVVREMRKFLLEE